MIPILRPRLPSTERLAPYLRKIDASRYYSNFGPLVLALEERLSAHYGLNTGTVATVGNATSGLALALAAQDAPKGSLCAMPAWTFIASAHAAVTAGLTPYFVDVDARTWAIDPSAVGAAIARAPAPVGAVMPVAPFGQPLDMDAWDQFRKQTALAVVVDAAAGFDSLVPRATPAVVSLHATKVLGVGEGGFVISTDAAVIADIRRRSNFGFDADRQVVVPATNAKLSEYHAAVGHAALDSWHEARAEWMEAGNGYRRSFSGSNSVRLQNGFANTWISGTCVISVNGSVCAQAQEALAAAEIDTRHWWGHGAHMYPATAHFPRDSLPETSAIAESSFAIPFYCDLQAADIDRIAEIIHVAATKPTAD